MGEQESQNDFEYLVTENGKYVLEVCPIGFCLDTWRQYCITHGSVALELSEAIELERKSCGLGSGKYNKLEDADSFVAYATAHSVPIRAHAKIFREWEEWKACHRGRPPSLHAIDGSFE